MESGQTNNAWSSQSAPPSEQAPLDVAWVLAWCIVGILKGKLMMAAVGAFVPVVAQVAALRLAKPGSPWARRFYPPSSEKLARATVRQRRYAAISSRLLDVLGGAPSVPRPDGDERSPGGEVDR
jgi:hypothetical protein